MEHRKIYAAHVGAFGCWALGLALVLIGMLFVEQRTSALGLMFAAAGAVLNVKGFLDEMESRERRAFDIGRQVGAASNGGDDVKHIH